MFKNYLRVMPSGLQLCIFACFFSMLAMIFSLLTPLIIQAGTHHTVSAEAFITTEFIHYPTLFALLNALSLVFIFLLPSLLFAYLAHPKPMQYLGYRKPQQPNMFLWIIVMAIGLLLAVGVLAQWIQDIPLGKWADGLQDERQQLEQMYLNSKNISSVFINIFFVGLVPAICEETFFRGVVMRFLNTWFHKPWVSILGSAVVFALVHLSVYNLVPIIIMGIILAWVYFQTSSLWLNIFLHFLFNSAQVVMTYFISTNTDSTTNIIAQIIVFLVGGGLLWLGIDYINKNKTPLPKTWSVAEKPIVTNN